MPTFCAVKGCGARHRKGDNISFHAFPHRNPTLMSRWLRALGREDMQPKSHHRVCSQHFKASCFYAGLDRPCLRPDAVPTEFADCCKAWLTGGKKQGTSDTASLVTTSAAHGMATRSATKVQEKKAAQNIAEHVAATRRTKDASTNTTLSLSKDMPFETRTTDSEGQPLPKKRLFQLRHEAEGQAKSQAKELRHVSTSKPAHTGTGGPETDIIISDVVQIKRQESDEASACCLSPEESGIDRVLNRDLDSGGPDPVLTATGALFLHTYCGERSEPEQVARLRRSLQAAKRRLALVERRLKRKTEAFAELLSTNKELEFELSVAQRLEQQGFTVSERLPQDLLRDWHENAGRVPHARRYSPLTLRFAIELHTCSRTAYEHVARWLPMPTLHLVRRHSAAPPSSSGDSGRDAVTNNTADRTTASATSFKFKSVPASRFASSVPRSRNPAKALSKTVTKPSTSSPATFVAPVMRFNVADTIRAGSEAPTLFVINSATMPGMTIPTITTTESTLSTAMEMTPTIMTQMMPPTVMVIPATVMGTTPAAAVEAPPANMFPATMVQVAPLLTTKVTPSTMVEIPAITTEVAPSCKMELTPVTSTEAAASLPSLPTSEPPPAVTV